VWTLCAVFGLLVIALPAIAAEIVEVRVGIHPEFTRVVFELDRAAGYRIERTDPSLGVQELVVSLEASSGPRRVKSAKSFIEEVDVQPDGRRSIARVRLSADGLRLKEMILSNPARIVLDVMADKPKTSAPAVVRARPKKPAATQQPRPSSSVTRVAESTERGFDEVVAEIPAEIETHDQVARVEEPPEPAIKQAVETGSVIQAEPIAEPIAGVEEDVKEEAEAFFDDAPAIADSGEPSTSVPIEEPEAALAESKIDLDEPNTPERFSIAPRPQTSGSRPMVAKTTLSGDEERNWMVWALAGGAFVLMGGGILLARRGKSDEVMFEEAGDPLGDATSSDTNPFMDVDSEETTAMPIATNGEDVTLTSSVFGQQADEEKESESVFGDSEETVMDDMEVISRDQVNESLGGSMPSAIGGAVPEEFQQMMMEMSRRIEGLETRCDELVDARDRLERQVAAQTEELRVQRAAIARTQRAVRNLGRPEDGDQEATEPTLRDPNRPAPE
jgi:hypothetical protein